MMKFPDKFSISFLLQNYEQQFYPLYLISDVKEGVDKILTVLQSLKIVNLSFILHYLLNFREANIEFILKLKKLFEFSTVVLTIVRRYLHAKQEHFSPTGLRGSNHIS